MSAEEDETCEILDALLSYCDDMDHNYDYETANDKRARSVAGLLARRKILCKRFSTKSRMALENRADSGLDPLITESHGGQNGMCAGTA